MIGMQTIAGRGRAGFADFVAPSNLANAPLPSSGDPDGSLAQCLALLLDADSQFAGLPDDDPASAAILAWMDTLLGHAATLRPASDRGFAIKARIADVYGDCPAGDRVQRWLLSDLMIRGRA